MLIALTAIASLAVAMMHPELAQKDVENLISKTRVQASPSITVIPVSVEYCDVNTGKGFRVTPGADGTMRREVIKCGPEI
jgi:hypothetical protein